VLVIGSPESTRYARLRGVSAGVIVDFAEWPDGPEWGRAGSELGDLRAKFSDNELGAEWPDGVITKFALNSLLLLGF
jgi:hypothetical protein